MYCDKKSGVDITNIYTLVLDVWNRDYASVATTIFDIAVMHTIRSSVESKFLYMNNGTPLYFFISSTQ